MWNIFSGFKSTKTELAHTACLAKNVNLSAELIDMDRRVSILENEFELHKLTMKKLSGRMYASLPSATEEQDLNNGKPKFL